MKKGLVNYDSDEERDPKPETKIHDPSISVKKKLDYRQLPISNKINIKEGLVQLKSEKEPANISETQNTGVLNKKEHRVFNLPDPKKAPQIPESFKIKLVSNPFKPKPQPMKSKMELSNEDINEEPVNYFDSKPNFFLNQEEEDPHHQEDNIEENEEENADKLLEYLNKRQRNSKKAVNVQEVSGKHLLDFDWHGYRERQKIKKETSLAQNIKAPNKVQKSKHQLTYLAYEAITKSEELENRKNEARKNHMLTQQKYGW